MGKVSDNAKYMIRLSLEADSLVERPDIIGAIFGQTEGLLGQNMDLRELQENGKIGRINIIFKESNHNKTKVEIQIPSSLSLSETALVSASIETVDKVGYTSARIKLIEISDLRNSKRKYIEERSKEILERLYNILPDTKETLNKVSSEIRMNEIKNYNGVWGGPNIEDSKEVILVEGRADVINLLRYGIKNVLSVEGSKLANQVKELTKNKVITVFLDGDRGGDLILKGLSKFLKIDYIARAPDGKEVEELTKKEIVTCLKNKRSSRLETKNLKSEINSIIKNLLGTKEVVFLDSKLNEIYKTSYSEFVNTLKIVDMDNVYAVVMDGKLTKDIAEQLKRKGIEVVGCFEREKFKINLKIYCIHDF